MYVYVCVCICNRTPKQKSCELPDPIPRILPANIIFKLYLYIQIKRFAITISDLRNGTSSVPKNWFIMKRICFYILQNIILFILYSLVNLNIIYFLFSLVYRLFSYIVRFTMYRFKAPFLYHSHLKLTIRIYHPS